MQAKDLIALEFKTKDDLLACLHIIFGENPGVYYELPGGTSVIVAKRDLVELAARLAEKQITYQKLKVISAGDAAVREIVNEKRAEYVTGRHFKKRIG